jgi:exodeoxyribonuclease III
LRIVVWNCRMALARKLDALLSLQPDIAVLPEAGDASRLGGTSLFDEQAVTYEWIGRHSHKGLGAMGREPYRVTPIPGQLDLEWILPLRVTGGPVAFTLIAVWAMNHRASNKQPGENSLRQVDRALDTHPQMFTNGPVVVAGDFNNSVCWDKEGKPEHPGNFAVTARRLSEVGLVSAYHQATELDYGAEADPTLYWQTNKIDGPRYHIDYCFLPQDWTPDVEVTLGTFTEWVGSGRSDHVPMIVDIAIPGAERVGA